MDLMARTQVDPWPTIDHHDRQILLSVLAQFLALGAKGGGSKALSADHSDTFDKSLEGICKEVAVTIQKNVIKWLVDLNFSNVEHYPQLEHGKISDSDIQTLSAAVSALYTAGALTPDPTLEQWIRSSMHAPDLPDDIAENYSDRQTAKTTVVQAPPPNGPPEENTNDEDDEPEDDLDDNGGEDQLTAAERAERKALINAIRAKDELIKIWDPEYAKAGRHINI